MKNLVTVILPVLASIFLIANIIVRNSAGKLTGKTVASLPLSLIPGAPGGFEVKGACDLQGVIERRETVDLGMFVKHGLVATKNFFPEDCTTVERHVINPKRGSNSSVEDFIHSPNEHKILAMRNRASFYKSVFNHVCNNRFKEKWRKENNVNCRREGEFAKLLKLNEREIAPVRSPFGLKEIIMKSKGVKKIMLADYSCIPKVITSLCGEPVSKYDSIAGRPNSNSASSQNYTDFWSMHNYALPVSPYDRFWDDVNDVLADMCCIELVKIE